jgi:hypothetical protein
MIIIPRKILAKSSYKPDMKYTYILINIHGLWLHIENQVWKCGDFTFYFSSILMIETSVVFLVVKISHLRIFLNRNRIE